MKKQQIAKESLQAIEKGQYQNEEGKIIDLTQTVRQAVQQTEYWAEEDFEGLFLQRDGLLLGADNFKTVYEVNNETTLQACKKMTTSYEKVFCLNFASAKNPGGGFLGGASAQEESLARSSALYPCLLKGKTYYDFHRAQSDCYYSDKMIYAPLVPVFRDDKGAWLDNFYQVSFLTSPAVNVGCLKDKNEYQEQKADEYMLQRTEKVLSIAFVKGYKHLVLGAWGCGVFRNESEKVARYFAHFLREGGIFENKFEHIIFAVLSRSGENITAFEETFG